MKAHFYIIHDNKRLLVLEQGDKLTTFSDEFTALEWFAKNSSNLCEEGWQPPSWLIPLLEAIGWSALASNIYALAITALSINQLNLYVLPTK